MAVRAYVLIRCEGAISEEVVRKLRQKEHVKQADTIFGDYDAIAYLEISAMPSSFSVLSLQKVILEEVQKIKGVTSTNTHIVTSPE